MEVTKEASDKTLTLKYQGRKTSRAGSEQRRKAILEAALRIVVRDGVRGVRHRAVAREADVPLSATTYYFKDISDLITDAFTLFVDMGAKKYRTFLDGCQEDLANAVVLLREDSNSKAQVIAAITDLMVNYLRDQLLHRRDYLLAEQAFRLECLRNENLKPIAQEHNEYLLADSRAFFSEIGSKSPSIDAALMYQMINGAEYDGLLMPEGDFNEIRIRSFVSRGVQHLFSGIFQDSLTH